MDVKRHLVSVSLVWLVVCGLVLLMGQVLGFDLAVSPGWQVLVYWVLVSVFCLLWYLTAVCLFFPRVRGWGWMAFLLGLGSVLGSLGVGFLHEGGYPGFRHPGLEGLFLLAALGAAGVVLSVRVYRPVLLWVGRALGVGV